MTTSKFARFPDIINNLHYSRFRLSGENFLGDFQQQTGKLCCIWRIWGIIFEVTPETLLHTVFRQKWLYSKGGTVDDPHLGRR